MAVLEYGESGMPDRSIRAHGYGASRSVTGGRKGDGERMDTEQTQYEIDERFLEDWITFGMAEMSAYLDKHARFAEFCDRRDSAPKSKRRRTQ